jgi:hypothetical protein
VANSVLEDLFVSYMVCFCLVFFSIVSRFLAISIFLTFCVLIIPRFSSGVSFQNSHENENPRIIDSSYLKTKF